MATVTLRPSSDGTVTGWTPVLAASIAAAIVDDPDSNDGDLSYALSPNAADGTCYVLLDDVPGDFDPAAINSITIKVAHRRINTPAMAVDAGTVNAFLVRSDEATAISTTPTAVASPIQAGYALTSFTPSPTGTHTVSDWNGARLALVFDHTAAQTLDTVNAIRITAAEVTIDYTPVAAPYTADLTTPSFAVTSQSLTRLNEFLATASAASFALVSQAVSAGVLFVAELSTAAFGFAAQANTWLADFSVRASAGSFGIVPQAVTRLAAFVASATAAAFGFVAQAVSYAGEAVVTATKNIAAVIQHRRGGRR